MPASDLDAYEEVWNAADEQCFSTDLRSDLAKNGLRVGLYGRDLPGPLQAQLDAPQDLLTENKEDATSTDAELGGSKRHLQIRSGRWKRVEPAG